jgi:hypothetical protein
LLSLLGAVAVIALLMLGAAGVLTSATLLWDPLGILLRTRNILRHDIILTVRMARDAVVAENMIAASA